MKIQELLLWFWIMQSYDKMFENSISQDFKASQIKKFSLFNDSRDEAKRFHKINLEQCRATF
jgi:hypothetical protein